jgi:hypothetical protein
MTKRKPKLLHEFGSSTLPNIARLLNSEPSSLRDELRRLFARYRESGPNLKKMMAADKELARTMRDMWVVRFVFSDSGFADLEVFGQLRPADEFTPRYKAVQFFARLIRNPEWAKLDGPCEWCEKYFVRQRRSFRTKEHVYCSRACSAVATATASMKAERDREYFEKLEKCRAKGESWTPDCGMSFRDYVSLKTGYTRSWVGRAIKHKDPERRLLEPKRKSKGEGREA